MSSFRKPTILVILDTNAVHSSKPGRAINPTARGLIDECRGLATVDLCVVETVAQELAFQSYKPARIALGNLQKNFRTVYDVTGWEHEVDLEDDSLRDMAEQKVLVEFEDAGLKVLPLPVELIDWNRVARDACWRNCVFEDSEDKQKHYEKGFRDRLVLESALAHFSGNALGSIERVFICGDRLLKESMERRSSEHGLDVLVFDSLEALVASLQIRSEDRNRAWGAKVIAQVARAFFDPDDPNCIYFREDLQAKLVDQFSTQVGSEFMLLISEAVPKSKVAQNLAKFALAASRSSLPPYQRFGGLRLRVGATAFDKNEEERFYWATKVEIACLFHREAGVAALIGSSDDRARIVTVAIAWSCHVNFDTGDVSDSRLEGINDRVETKVVQATYSIKNEFELPQPPILLRGMEPPPQDTEARTLQASGSDQVPSD